MGQFKWKALGLNYELASVEPPSKELVERACAQFRQAGLKAY
jgi:pyruvate formate lyase activating enzyme